MQILQTDYEILKACHRQLQNFLPWGIFCYVWSLKIMCIALIVLLLKNKFILHFFFICSVVCVCLCKEILIDWNLFKCLIAIKCSESRVEALQIFFTWLLIDLKIWNWQKFLSFFKTSNDNIIFSIINISASAININ